MSTNNTDNAIQRWSAVKSAIARERQRLLAEYAKAQEQVLAACGQDVAQLGKPLVVHNKPIVAIRQDGEIAVAVGDGVMTGLSGLQPSDHWPGQLGLWETVLAALCQINANAIIKAWGKATE